MSAIGLLQSMSEEDVKSWSGTSEYVVLVIFLFFLIPTATRKNFVFIYLIRFEAMPTTENVELQGVTEEVVVEYHKDKKRWIIDKEYYDSEGGFIDHDTNAFTPLQKAEYITIAQREYNTKTTNNVWDDIIAADDYQTYDSFVGMVKNYYASKHNNSDDVAMKVEDDINSWFIDLIATLNKKYLM